MRRTRDESKRAGVVEDGGGCLLVGEGETDGRAWQRDQRLMEESKLAESMKLSQRSLSDLVTLPFRALIRNK